MTAVRCVRPGTHECRHGPLQVQHERQRRLEEGAEPAQLPGTPEPARVERVRVAADAASRQFEHATASVKAATVTLPGNGALSPKPGRSIATTSRWRSRLSQEGDHEGQLAPRLWTRSSGVPLPRRSTFSADVLTSPPKSQPCGCPGR